ncbi:MAG: hypothetical protein AB8F94_12490 [Saprospiraceae bacterium]
MNWKFTCELISKLSLPPEITFPQVLNYLNPENNSFYILENENGYIQCAGSKSNCTIEFREYLKDGLFKHFVFFDPNGGSEKMDYKMSNRQISRMEKHSFKFLKAAKLFSCFYENKDWPEGFELEEITKEFK